MVGVGVMSGTSLDGLDLALCSFFEKESGGYGFKLIDNRAIEYSSAMMQSLKGATSLSGYDFIKLHRSYGQFIGNEINSFLLEKNLKADFIASHGHTTFHEPHNNISFQVGDGATIAATSGITTVSDFRTYDIALGGQGAPLVPIGDMELFAEYDVCVNLGGFANLSFNKIDDSSVRIAYDICPVNFVVNRLVNLLGFDYDEAGEIGKSGVVDTSLLSDLNNLAYYKQIAPKSLGQEWVFKNMMPLLDASQLTINDKVRTIYEHIAIQISEELNRCDAKRILFTGGGSHNSYLMSLISARTRGSIEIPDKRIVDFKEAIIFGFLGYLRLLNRPNCLASVTGARRNNIGGVVHLV